MGKRYFSREVLYIEIIDGVLIIALKRMSALVFIMANLDFVAAW